MFIGRGWAFACGSLRFTDRNAVLLRRPVRYTIERLILGERSSYNDIQTWKYASLGDADSGEWKWRVRSNYPTLSGITPTAGGIVFFGDMGENFYALDASDGKRLWAQKLDGAVGGGVITYTANGSEKVAAAGGINRIFWPTKVATAKIVILGLREPPLQ